MRIGTQRSADRKLADLCGSELSAALIGNLLTCVDRKLADLGIWRNPLRGDHAPSRFRRGLRGDGKCPAYSARATCALSLSLSLPTTMPFTKATQPFQARPYTRWPPPFAATQGRAPPAMCCRAEAGPPALCRRAEAGPPALCRRAMAGPPPFAAAQRRAPRLCGSELSAAQIGNLLILVDRNSAQRRSETC